MPKIKLNESAYRDKVFACWMGKNIGGTLGTPYEGQRDTHDITGFASKKGEPLPNDDLDLQLVWLTAMEDVGPWTLDASALADYWLSYVPVHFNEYGIGKANVRQGLMPPLSGEYQNDGWKNSNGAWIRSEIWACLAPGYPNVAIRYALADACIDHGVSEGTHAEVFTAALESLAFFETDVRRLIERGLGFIPENSRLAQSVRLVMREYDNGTPWRETREKIVEFNRDLGWFQAPGNVAFTVIGLLYGEGDFKKTLITAVNCGDDTDCTAATCGSILGIMGGTAVLPPDWCEYIGEDIICIAADRGSNWRMPQNCREMTDRVANLMPAVLIANGVSAGYTDGADEYDPATAETVGAGMAARFFDRSPCSFDVNTTHTLATVFFDGAPEILPETPVTVHVRLTNLRPDPRHLTFDVSLPDGWTADYRRTAFIGHPTPNTQSVIEWSLTVTAAENIRPVNRLTVTVLSETHAPLLLPITLLG